MKKNDFIDTVSGLVWVYINNADVMGKNAQIRVTPESLYVDLFTEKQFQQAVEDADEAIENAAIAHGAESEEALDFQASQNPDFYPASSLVTKNAEGRSEPSREAIEKVAANYF